MPRKVWIAVGVCVLLLGAVFLWLRLGLLRQEVANQKATGLGAVSETPISGFWARNGSSPAYEAVTTPAPSNVDKKVIQTASLDMIVKNVDEAAERLRLITIQSYGQIDQVRLWSPTPTTRAGELHLRVLAGRLNTDLRDFKQVALRVTSEQVTATDVTRQFADSEARMRNMKAEEAQYLVIMRQAKSVQDTLDVAEKLSDVRGRIEELQAEINVMSHDIAMSQVTITLTQDEAERGTSVSWHPLRNLRASGRDLLRGLGDWADWVVSVIVVLPVILLWIVTIGAILLLVWRIAKVLWTRRPQWMRKA